MVRSSPVSLAGVAVGTAVAAVVVLVAIGSAVLVAVGVEVGNGVLVAAGCGYGVDVAVGTLFW
jgi:hypothetical protein